MTLEKKIQQAYLREESKDYSDNRISYTQFSMYSKCPKSWYLAYAKNLRQYRPSIHTVFGTAVHETLQHYLDTCFNDSVKKANCIDLEGYLIERMQSVYKDEVGRIGGDHFSNLLELTEFWQDGVEILRWVKAKRSQYFSTRQYKLLGIEIPLICKVSDTNSELDIIAYLDVVLYDKTQDIVRIIDIKTSTKGWSKWDKADEVKRAQVLIYKHFFSKQFDFNIDNIDVDFFIVKRKLIEDCEFPQKRVQEYKPSQGKITIGKMKKDLDAFISECFDQDGNFILNKDYKAIAGKNGKHCRFCEFRDNQQLCPTYKRTEA